MIDVQSTLLRRCNIFVKKEDIYTCVCVYAYVYTYVYILWIYYREREKKNYQQWNGLHRLATPSEGMEQMEGFTMIPSRGICRGSTNMSRNRWVDAIFPSRALYMNGNPNYCSAIILSSFMCIPLNVNVKKYSPKKVNRDKQRLLITRSHIQISQCT